MQVSVIIIARDAGRFLPSCLASVKSLSDDVVVVIDDRTTDGSRKVAQDSQARTFTRKFINFSNQKNYAASEAKYNWIFSLDADETASLELVAAIKNLPEISLFPAYSVPRKNKIFGQIINHTNWDPYGLVRLYDKSKCHWQGEVHEQVAVDGTAGRLYDPIHHDNYHTVDEFLARQNVYSSLEADRLFNQGTRFSFVQLFFQPLFDFGRRYIWHAGFLDGMHGLALSYLMAVYHLSVWVKLWQK